MRVYCYKLSGSRIGDIIYSSTFGDTESFMTLDFGKKGEYIFLPQEDKEIKETNILIISKKYNCFYRPSFSILNYLGNFEIPEKLEKREYDHSPLGKYSYSVNFSLKMDLSYSSEEHLIILRQTLCSDFLKKLIKND